jgi:hypothetical protein
MRLSPDALFSNDAVYTTEEMPLTDAWVVLPSDVIVEDPPHEPGDYYYVPGLHRIVACSAGTPPEEMVRTQDSRGYDVDTPTIWLQLPEATPPFQAYSLKQEREAEVGLTFACEDRILARLATSNQPDMLVSTSDVCSLPLLLLLTVSTQTFAQAYDRSLHRYILRLKYPGGVAVPDLSQSSQSNILECLRGVSERLRIFRKAGLTCTLDPGFWGLPGWGAIPLRGVAGDRPLIERYARGLA